MGEACIPRRFISIKCLKVVITELASILAYLIAELVLFLIVLGASLGISDWLTRLVPLVTHEAPGNVLWTYFLIYPVGILATQVAKFHHDLVPSFSFDLRRRCPFLFGFLRMLIIASSLIVGTWFLFQCYSWKWSRKQDGNEIEVDEKMRMCDLIFLGSLSLLVYVYARVTESYREVNRMEVELKQRPWRRVECPSWHIYLFYFLQLVLLEFFESGICAAVLIGFCMLLQFLFSMELLTFLVSCGVAFCLGYFVGVFEGRWFFCDEYYGSFEPFFTAIHWDARQNIIVFSILPNLSRWYFYLQFEGPNGPLTNFSVYIGCVATTILIFAKCQTLFSFLMREDEDAPHFERRIHPANVELDQQGERNLPEVPRRRSDSVLAGLQLLIRSILSPHFASKRHQRADYISTSTGTCTTLLQRVTSATSHSGGTLLPPAFTFSTQDYLDSCQQPPPQPPNDPPLPATDINCNMLLLQPTTATPSHPNIPQIVKSSCSPVHSPVSAPLNNNNDEYASSENNSIHNQSQLVQTSVPSSPPAPLPPSQKIGRDNDFLRSSSVSIIIPINGEVEDKQNKRDSRAITLRKCLAATFIPVPLKASSSEVNNHDLYEDG